MVRIASTAVAALVLPVAPVLAADGTKEYLDGLDQLEAGKFAEAAAQFEKAIEQNDENASSRRRPTRQPAAYRDSAAAVP